MQKITPFLWFDNNAEEAADFYTSIFKNSKVLTTRRYPEGAPRPAGSVMSVDFELEGQLFIALNGGPQFTFSPAISFFVDCHSQQEIDDLWDKLAAGGQTQGCGWVQDKFGVSWQIVPTRLGELLQSNDAEKTQRTMAAMFGMGKLDIAELEQAYEQP